MIDRTFSRIGWACIGIGFALLALAFALSMAGAAEASECLTKRQIRAEWGSVHRVGPHCWQRDGRSAKTVQRKGRAAPPAESPVPIDIMVPEPFVPLPTPAPFFPISLPSEVATSVGFWQPPATVLAFAPAGWVPVAPLAEPLHAAPLAPVGLGAAAALAFGFVVFLVRASALVRRAPSLPVPVVPLRPAPPDRRTPVPPEFARRIMRPRRIAGFEPETGG